MERDLEEEKHELLDWMERSLDDQMRRLLADLAIVEQSHDDITVIITTEGTVYAGQE